MQRLAPIVLLTLGVVTLLAATVIATRISDPGYTRVESEIALGPARQHTPSAIDLVARVAKGALDAAAGSPEETLPDLDGVAASPEEEALRYWVNVEREHHGLAPLEFDPALLAAARTRAAAQLPEGPLSHYNALGEFAFIGLLGEAGVDYSFAGENLARSTLADETVVDRLHTALMNSPTHRANILHPDFNLLAIGAASDASGRIAFAQIFRGAWEQDAADVASPNPATLTLTHP